MVRQLWPYELFNGKAWGWLILMFESMFIIRQCVTAVKQYGKNEKIMSPWPPIYGPLAFVLQTFLTLNYTCIQTEDVSDFSTN